MGIPIKRRIETKRPGIVRQVGKLGVGIVIKLKAHRINRSPTFFPELFFDGIHCRLRETQKVFKFMFDIWKKYRRFVCKIGTWSEKRMSAEKVLRLAWVTRNSTESSPWICSRLAAIAIALSSRQYNTLHTSQLKPFPNAHLKWNGRLPSLSLLSSLWKVPFVLHIYDLYADCLFCFCFLILSHLPNFIFHILIIYIRVNGKNKIQLPSLANVRQVQNF